MEKTPEPVVTDAADAPEPTLLNHVDIVVVVLYFFLVMATGIYVGIRLPQVASVTGGSSRRF